MQAFGFTIVEMLLIFSSLGLYNLFEAICRYYTNNNNTQITNKFI